MLYDANDRPIEATLDDQQKNDQAVAQLPTENFPPPTPRPDWFDAAVTKIGGYFDPGVNKIPKYRVVWGMDPAITQFAMGKIRMKYVSIVDHYEITKGYNIINTKKDKKYFLSVKEAHKRYFDSKTGQLTRNRNPYEIISPVIIEEEKEIGQPWWVAEQFVPPEAFGDPVSWNNERYLINKDNPMDYIDALGEYPDKGKYIHWFDILDIDDDGFQVYKELDESVIEWIRANHVANIARRTRIQFTTPEQARAQRDNAWDNEWAKMDKELTTEMLDIKKHKHSISG